MNYLWVINRLFGRHYIVRYPKNWAKMERWHFGIINPCRGITLFSFHRGVFGGLEIIFFNIEVFVIR